MDNSKAIPMDWLPNSQDCRAAVCWVQKRKKSFGRNRPEQNRQRRSLCHDCLHHPNEGKLNWHPELPTEAFSHRRMSLDKRRSGPALGLLSDLVLAGRNCFVFASLRVSS
ncbi:MAG: hypothetical protein ACR2NN_14475, partial [Bryobacteraceae bacterium]